MLRIESPLSEKHPWTTATLKSRSFAVTRPQHVSLLFDLILTKEGKFKWTPVKRRRKKNRETAGSQDVSISSDSGSELDLSCSII